MAAAGSTLTEVVGVGPIMAGRLISRTGRAHRFPTASAFANYTGRLRWRLPARRSRGTVSHARGAATQLRPSHHCDHPDPHVGSRGNLYYRTKIAEGKTPREAARCLKGRLCNPARLAQPNNQLFGQVTSQTRQPRLYDDQASRLTNTDAPKRRSPGLKKWRPVDDAGSARSRVDLFGMKKSSGPRQFFGVPAITLTGLDKTDHQRAWR